MVEARDTLLTQALGYHETGDLAAAEPCYRRLLAANPRDADVLHLLGVLCHQTARWSEAVDHISRAVGLVGNNPIYHNNLGLILLAGGHADAAVAHLESALKLLPSYPEALNNLGNAHKAQGKLELAGDNYRAALKLKPDYAEAWFNFGNLLHSEGRLDQAIEVYRHALTVRPGYVDALANLAAALVDAGEWSQAIELLEPIVQSGYDDVRMLNNLGNACKLAGDLARAMTCYRRALDIDPEHPAVLNNLGNAIQQSGDLDGAIEIYRRLLQRHPKSPEGLSNLGNALQLRGLLEDAMACYGQALAVEPEAPVPLYNLGVALRKRNRLTEAANCLRRALVRRPDYAEALCGLGTVLVAQGVLDEAIALFERALAVKPDFPEALGQLMFALNSQPGVSAKTLCEATIRGVARWAPPVQSDLPVMERLAGWTERRLRVGYVSADLRSHPVGHFLGSVLANHDRTRIESFCYHNSWAADDVTARLKRGAHHWRDIAGINDAGVFERIAEDGIDLLVDLSGHSADHRLNLFRARAAPIQASWLGYFGTTGVAEMDFLIADRVIIPPEDDDCYSEAIVRLPGCYLCFDGAAAVAPVAPSPFAETGMVTFGAFNRRDKITPEVVALWSSILAAVPGSRLLVKNGSMADPPTADTLRAAFMAWGIDGERIILEGPVPRRQYLADYGRIDIALDPFPFGGGTTTAETLWMGVPLVSLRGSTWPGRISASMLAVIGLADLVADTAERYRGLAIGLAQDPARFMAMRMAMRRRVETGLCDATGFTRNLEEAYRAMAGRISAAGA